MTTTSKKAPTPSTNPGGPVADLLNQHLADTFDLYSQIKQAHWNVRDPRFIALHELFDTLAADTLPFVDELAERITALGAPANGTARMAGKTSRLPEFPAGFQNGDSCLTLLTDRFRTLSDLTRQAISTADDDHHDPASADFLTSQLRALDKSLYFLASHNLK